MRVGAITIIIIIPLFIHYKKEMTFQLKNGVFQEHENKKTGTCRQQRFKKGHETLQKSK